MRQRSISVKGTAGFSLIELLMVVAIIAIMAAVAIPAISRYFRNYQINSAVREVSGEIQAARNKAVMKNVNFGSVFYVRSATTYRVALEDDQNPALGRLPRALTLTGALEPLLFLRSQGFDALFYRGCHWQISSRSVPPRATWPSGRVG